VFDSHCHLTDERFADDLAAVLERAWSAGVQGIVTIASDADDAERARVIADSDARIWCTAGIHPHNASAADSAHHARIRAALEHPRVVALGETGLDYFYDNSPRAAQHDNFAWHLQTAVDTGLPVIVHSRDADDDTISFIRDFPAATGVLHCFSGGPALFDAALEAGWFISFAGMVTFRRYDGQSLVAATPADRLLTETDSPYIAPVPHRGKRNEPAFVTETARAIASIRGESEETVARVTTANARRFYRLPAGAPP
jgi:TatD DNase family protein